ncbi:MAG: hypothetical protein AABX27_00585 [Nanoarchaeota archaeon]
MDFLIPFFSEFYSISIRRPLVRAPVWKKERDFSGLFTPEGRNGLIELNRQHCNIEKGYHGVVAHELGHAAEYQHHKTYFNPIEDKEKDFIYDALREGIAMEFERAGLGGLLEAEIITKQQFDAGMHSYNNTLSYSSVFSLGWSMLSFLYVKAEMREIICSPEKYFNGLMSRYGKEINSILKKV